MVAFPIIKVFLSDVDGTMTDAGMYYDQNGNELKKFNTHDGKGFELLHNAGIKAGIVTGEETLIVTRRARKLKVDYLFQGVNAEGKVKAAREICSKEGVCLSEIAYIGDDINCIDLLKSVGLAACPANSTKRVKELPGIIHLEKSGGNGAVREFIDLIIQNNEI